MNQASYWQAQEDRWHAKYIEAQKAIDQLEMKMWEQEERIKMLDGALREIASLGFFDGDKACLIAQSALGGTDV